MHPKEEKSSIGFSHALTFSYCLLKQKPTVKFFVKQMPLEFLAYHDRCGGISFDCSQRHQRSYFFDRTLLYLRILPVYCRSSNRARSLSSPRPIFFSRVSRSVELELYQPTDRSTFTRSSMSQIAITIPVRNRKEITRQILVELNAQIQQCADREHLISVVIIDDGSTDGTGEMIRQQFPQFSLLEGDGSLWWTGAICWGMKYALEKYNPDYFVWLNDDIFLRQAIC